MFWLLPSTIEILLVSVVSTGLTEVIQELAVVTVLRDYAEARIFRRKKSPKLSSNEISLKYLVKGEILLLMCQCSFFRYTAWLKNQPNKSN